MDDDINICSEIWNDLDGEENVPMISFQSPIASLRFRYGSEVEKKSFSTMKAENNKCPIIEVFVTADSAELDIELVTTDEKNIHFNMLYEGSKEKTDSYVLGGKFIKPLFGCGKHEIKLESLGIMKMKNKEALKRIKELYPRFTDSEAKSFYNKHKDAVQLKATLSQYDIPAVVFYTNIIKSQLTNENKTIKIKHFSPKVVAETGEQLIVVLHKKITTDQFETYLVIEGQSAHILHYKDQDGQTFIFDLPNVDSHNPVDAKFIMRCGDSEDGRPIKFLSVAVEPRKRKADRQASNTCPLKRSTNYENRENMDYNARPLYPESRQLMDEIQTDSAMDMGDYNHNTINLGHYGQIDNESCKDSGFYTNDKSDQGTSDEDDLHSGNESGDEFIETEGFRRRNNVRSSPGFISVPPRERNDNSHLDMNLSNNATKKILSEVARIGHDFAFGKTPNDVFERFERQLPVVFTLQDDVGDTPLNNAILKGNVDNAFKILKTVQTHCNWALDLVNTSGHSAVILAPACDVPATLITELLNAGCRLDLWDDTGKSAIVYAIEYQNVMALEVLLKYVKEKKMNQVLSRYNTAYYSPLQLAILNNFKEGIRLLLELKDNEGNYMVNINEMGLMNDETALHMAVSRNCDSDVLNLLLQRPDIDVNKTSSRGETALHISNKMNLVEMSKVLRTHHAVDVAETSDIDNVDDSDDEMDDNIATEVEMVHSDTNHSTESATIQEKVPVLEEIPLNTSGVNQITHSMSQLTLKGERKRKLIDILIMSEGPTLSIQELKQIVKPSFKPLFTKYGNTDEHKRDITEMLDRLNCLPSSLGKLLADLDYLGRVDLIDKIRGRLEVLSNC